MRFWTLEGIKRLGKLIKLARSNWDLSLDDLVERIRDTTGRAINKKTIGNIENAVSIPAYNTLAAIAACRIVTDEQGRILDEYDFVDIAAETYVPYDKKTFLLEIPPSLWRKAKDFSEREHISVSRALAFYIQDVDVRCLGNSGNENKVA